MLFGGLSQDVKDTFIKPKALASGNARFDGAGETLASSCCCQKSAFARGGMSGQDSVDYGNNWTGRILSG